MSDVKFLIVPVGTVAFCWIGPSIHFGCACGHVPTESAKGRRVRRVTRPPSVVVSSCEGGKITPCGAHIVFTVAHARGVVSVDLTLGASAGTSMLCMVERSFFAKGPLLWRSPEAKFLLVPAGTVAFCWICQAWQCFTVQSFMFAVRAGTRFWQNLKALCQGLDHTLVLVL